MVKNLERRNQIIDKFYVKLIENDLCWQARLGDVTPITSFGPLCFFSENVLFSMRADEEPDRVHPNRRMREDTSSGEAARSPDLRHQGVGHLRGKGKGRRGRYGQECPGTANGLPLFVRLSSFLPN